MPGKPVPIAKPIPSDAADEEGDRFEFNYNLPQLISSPERLANAKVVIVSVAGAFRKGKSFLLNFFLRFLRAQSRGDTRNWIHSADGLEDGFHWRSGCDRDTTGILIWSEPFFIRKPNGEEVAVLLVDTQGTFDHQSTQQDCTTIFAFSTLLSSVQIFNISQNIQETDLQYLRLFVEFASMAKGSKEKILQHLWFLVRDWQYPDEYKYGVEEGGRYLEKVLACDNRKPRENQELRRGIRQHFEKASCCLLPHPGKAVTAASFRGAVKDLNTDFVENLKSFVAHILSPNNLIVKKVNAKELTGRDLFDLVQVYYGAFRFGKLPTPKSIFVATVEMANLAAAEDAKKFFEGSMKSLCGTQAVSDQELDNLLKVILEQAIEQFDSKCMEPRSRDTAGMRKRLEEQLRGLFQQQRVMNQLKSDKIAAEKKNEMLADNIKRMQAESLQAVSKMTQLELQFADRVREIQRQAISKDQMEKLLQEELVKHSAAQKEQEKMNQDLEQRVEEMAQRNAQLVDELRDGEQTRRKLQEMMAIWRQEMEERTAEQEKAAQSSESVLGDVVSVVGILGVLGSVVAASFCCIS